MHLHLSLHILEVLNAPSRPLKFIFNFFLPEN
jgi:hypothetical protein